MNCKKGWAKNPLSLTWKVKVRSPDANQQERLMIFIMFFYCYLFVLSTHFHKLWSCKMSQTHQIQHVWSPLLLACKKWAIVRTCCFVIRFIVTFFKLKSHYLKNWVSFRLTTSLLEKKVYFQLFLNVHLQPHCNIQNMDFMLNGLCKNENSFSFPIKSWNSLYLRTILRLRFEILTV